MKAAVMARRSLALLLVFSMLFGLIACARPEKSPAGDNTNTLLDKDEYTREEMELIVDLLGNGQSTENMTDEELKELVDEIVSSNKGSSSSVVNLSTQKNDGATVDTTDKDEFYGTDGEIKVPFDEIYPELIENEEVEFSGESILVKLSQDKLTKGLKAAGIAALDEIVPLEDSAWYEAKLKKGTDAKKALEDVRELSEVILAEFNYEIKTAAIDDYKHFDDKTDEEFKKNGHNKDQWHFHYAGIPDGYEEMDNKGGLSTTVVAVIDTGVDYDHEDLKDNIWVNKGETPDNGIDDDGNGYVDDYYGVDMVAGKGSADDDNGHGTHVAGIIAARNNNVGVVGVAYNTKIMPIKAAMHNGTLNQADIAESVLYAYEMGAEVINMSFGGTACSIAVQDALAVAYTRCVLVASAGNSGAPNEGLYAIPNYPAALSYVLGVMSVDQYGVESSFSNYDVVAFNGVEYELYAPGESIMSTMPGDKYGYLSGTSMAAPMVSAMAAILRGEYSDRDMYPTKFIYGQLASTSDYIADCYDPSPLGHGHHNLPQVVNLNAALTKLPKPEVNLQDYYIFDSVELSDKNNGDGVIDAGETIALGFTLRNRWGMSENTIVSINTLINGISDPYVNIINDTVNYGSVGTYSTQDCGKIMTDGLFTGWEDPFLIKIADDCPNDYRMTFFVEMRCENALNEEDETVYSSSSSIDLTARNGVILPSVIDEDMTLTKDNLYIIPNSTVINKGVTVRVEPGTHIQFWTDDPKDAYADTYIAYLLVNGKLLVEGTKEEPVMIYPSQLMDRYGVEIGSSSTGYVSLKHADITNFFYDTDHTGTYSNIDNADHCTFRMNYGHSLRYRWLSSGKVSDNSCGNITIGKINAKDSVFYKVGQSNYITRLYGTANRCIFVDCGISMEGNAQNCVFLGNNFVDQTKPNYSTSMSMSMETKSSPVIKGVYYREKTGTTYVWAENLNGRELLKKAYGFEYAVVETQDELDWIYDNISKNDYEVGIYHDGEKYVWSDGTEILPFIDRDGVVNSERESVTLKLCLYDPPRVRSTGTSRELYEIKGHILPTDITFEEYEVSLDTGASYQLSPVNTPVQLPLDAFVYESTDESVVKVNEKGLVTPVGEGSAEVWVSSLDGAVKNYVSFNVVDYVPLEDLALAEDEIFVAAGEMAKIKCIFTPANTTRKNVVFTSDDTSVATVDNAGNVTGVSKGKAKIIAKCEGLTVEMTVHVYNKASSISIDEYIYANLEDGTIALPEVATDGDPILDWSSTDTSVADIEDGNITLKKPGTTNLIVTDKRTGLQDTAILYVFENGLPEIKYVYGDYNGSCVLTEDGRVFIWGRCTAFSVPTEIFVGKNIEWCAFVPDSSEAFVLAVDKEGMTYECVSFKSSGSNSISGPYDDVKGMDIAGLVSSYDESLYYVLTTAGEIYVWEYNKPSVTLVDLPFKVAEIKVSDYNRTVFILSEDGTIYSSRSGWGNDITIVARNVTEFERTYAYWYVSDGVLYYKGLPTEFSFDGCSDVALCHSASYTAYSLSVKDGELYLGEHYVNNNYGYQERHKEYHIDLGEPVKQVYYDYFAYAITESNVIYKISWDSNYYISEENLFADAIVVETFEDDHLAVENTNLESFVIEDIGEVNILHGNTLELTLNKIPAGTEGITLLEDGYTVPAIITLENNVLRITSNVGFAVDHAYTLNISKDMFPAQSGATFKGDYSLSFFYEEGGETEKPEEKPGTEEEAPKDKVIHTAIFDDSVERILTVEKLQAELDALQEKYQFNDKFYANAVLNPFSTVYEVEKWFRPMAPSVSAGTYTEIPLGGNYWGTTNERAIELQMVDYTDFITYARLMYAPFVTEAPENTFPFVTSVKLFNERGEEVTVVGNETITFRVTFNRDMDTSIPLTVRFGSAYPYGDYEIEGQYVDARTWEGTYTLKTIIENGYQYFTISNGCSATEDLELQTDRMRFGFEIDTTAAQALIMQGAATDTGIELKWTQDDFDTLMGYNVYRSDREDGLYVRLNSTVIPADTMEFFDNTVEPGKVYYYNFTVVMTDLTESEPSGKITIMSKDTMAPDIYHSPVAGAFTGANLVISATVTDNLNIAYANLYYRAVGESEWNIIRMNSLNDKYSAIVLASDVTVAGIEYYIEAFDGVSFTYKGSEDAPFTVAVQEAISADALGDVNGDGAITNYDALILLYAINDKYNMSQEEFARADLNGDGELWAAEALRILQYVSGIVGSVKIS